MSLPVTKDSKYYQNKYPVYYEMRQYMKSGETQRIGDFIEWLCEQGIELCRRDDYGELIPTMERRDEFICSFFEIDFKEFVKQQEDCQCEALAEQRELNKQ